MRGFALAGLALLGALHLAATPARADEPAIAAKLQDIVNAYVASRAEVEGLSGVALQVDRGGAHPILSVYAGDDGLPDKKPIGPDTLFNIGSNTKEFTAALILKLEADGLLSIDDKIGRWLPQYPAWKDVPIRSLLNMTSDIPNYSETLELGEISAADIHHQFGQNKLVSFVDPDLGHHFPKPTGWYYSNTNYVLAGMIVARFTTKGDFEQALTSRILEPLGLKDTFYANGPNPGPAAAGPAVIARLPRALFLLKDCLDYQPQPCSVSTLAPLFDKDMRTQNMSWAGAAGAMISNPRDLALWIRALFAKRVFPQKQLDEMTTLVSLKTGLPIEDVSASDPAAFGLGIGRFDREELGGKYWFYEGETLGFRMIFAYWPQYDLVITGGVNSRPPHGEDQFGPAVIGPAFAALQQAGLVGTEAK